MICRKSVTLHRYSNLEVSQKEKFKRKKKTANQQQKRIKLVAKDGHGE